MSTQSTAPFSVSDPASWARLLVQVGALGVLVLVLYGGYLLAGKYLDSVGEHLEEIRTIEREQTIALNQLTDAVEGLKQ